MHPSSALATVVVDELVRGGVREAVLAPGSRSAPLAYALEEADRSGRLRLHVRVDERSAGFLALGLARASGRPVPVVTTSGTAVANLHPAVLEAHHSGIPLVVLSADRPAELRGTGANQTTVQPGIFAGAVRWESDLPAPDEPTAAAAAHWRSTVCRALAATGHAGVGGAREGEGEPSAWWGSGPVHLNVGLRDPLAPELPGPDRQQVDPLPADLAGRPDGAPWTVSAPVRRTAGGLPGGGPADGSPGGGTAGLRPALDAGERTLVLLGDLPGPELATRALDWAAAAGWPVVAEPFGRLPTGASVVPHGPLVAAAVARGEADRLRPQRVVVVGRLTLFRELGALLRLPEVRIEQVCASEQWTDPSHVVSRVHPVDVLTTAPAPAARGDWLDAWVRAGERLTDEVLAVAGLGRGADSSTPPTGPGVAATVVGALAPGDQLVLGSSTVPRDLALVLDGRQAAVRVVSNRGLAGIDGTVSTAVGAALAGPRTVALMGDLTFLHDAGGLLVGPGEPCPDLTVVVVNDDGGGIFSTLEYGQPDRLAAPGGAAVAERLFGTPHGAGLAELCAAYRVEHRRVTSLAELQDALEASLATAEPGTVHGRLRVVEVPVERASRRRVQARLHSLAPASPDPDRDVDSQRSAAPRPEGVSRAATGPP